jgi:hypothetical protein
MYEFILKHNFVKGDKDEKRTSTIAIYSLVILIPFIALVVTPICRANNISMERYSGTWIGLFVVLLLLSIPIDVRYWKYDTYQGFKERWGKEDPKQRTRRGWLIWILIINNLILIPALVVLLEHYNIL